MRKSTPRGPGQITAAGPLSEPALDRRFEAMIFDWDAKAAPARRAEMARVRALIESLCAAGFSIGLGTGGGVGELDARLRARPRDTDPGCLLLASNRRAGGCRNAGSRNQARCGKRRGPQQCFTPA